jgi:hypothetical protein
VQQLLGRGVQHGNQVKHLLEGKAVSFDGGHVNVKVNHIQLGLGLLQQSHQTRFGDRKQVHVAKDQKGPEQLRLDVAS